jgi:hypothetical protein
MRFDPVLLSKVPSAVVLGKYGFCSAALPFSASSFSPAEKSERELGFNP